jgi:hypothetical protein
MSKELDILSLSVTAAPREWSPLEGRTAIPMTKQFSMMLLFRVQQAPCVAPGGVIQVDFNRPRGAPFERRHRLPRHALNSQCAGLNAKNKVLCGEKERKRKGGIAGGGSY